MKKWTCIILIFLILLTGCHSNNQPLSDKQFCLDTIVQITLYDSQSQDVLEGCFDICNNSELIFSATDPKSELYQINHSTNKLEMQTISDELYEVIAVGPGKVDDNGNRVALTVKKGDMVLFNKYAGTEVKLDGVDHLVLREDDVLAIIND